MIDRKLKFDTLQIHAGQEPDAATGSRRFQFIRLHPMYLKCTACRDLFH